MLSASLFSSIFGTLIPGSVYRSQNLYFQTPVYSDEQVIGLVEVVKVKNIRNRGVNVTCNTNVYKNVEQLEGKPPDKFLIAIRESNDVVVCVSGEATVWIPSTAS